MKKLIYVKRNDIIEKLGWNSRSGESCVSPTAQPLEGEENMTCLLPIDIPPEGAIPVTSRAEDDALVTLDEDEA